MTGRRNPLYDRLAAMQVGQQAVLIQGVDFHGNVENQRTNIHHAMYSRGVLCRSTKRNKQITITIINKEQKPDAAD